MTDGIRMLPERPTSDNILDDVDESQSDKPETKGPVVNDYSKDMVVTPAENVNDLRHGESYGRAQWTTNILLVITFVIIACAGYCYCTKKE
jgi:hypothetical protein